MFSGAYLGYHMAYHQSQRETSFRLRIPICCETLVRCSCKGIDRACKYGENDKLQKEGRVPGNALQRFANAHSVGRCDYGWWRRRLLRDERNRDGNGLQPEMKNVSHCSTCSWALEAVQRTVNMMAMMRACWS
jgi:hypothetical protein